MEQPIDIGGPAQPLLTISGMVKHFPLKKTAFGAGTVVRAVDGVDFQVMKGETLGVVGESGCGKSTTARLLMQLLKPTRGQMVFDGRAIGGRDLPLKEFRRQVQMVFQDSYASLNPRLSIEDTVAFGPQVHGMPRRAARSNARDLLARVGLPPQRLAERYPHELSGGQRQRVNIARALALQPRMVILDEAVSALDRSVQAQVINLLLDLKTEFGLTYLFISHDLNVVRYMSDRVMVMYLGQVVEIGPVDALYAAPAHPYTRALLSSIPSLDPEQRSEKAALSGDPPNPIDPPTGCRFHPRCALAAPVCARRAPKPIAAGAQHAASCLVHEPDSGHPMAQQRRQRPAA
ncbi:ABC transporter ATP-binding protein [Verminephrobacter eiseniae]|uniref:Glutathione import ATP-binding protein GsiA n=1 Tax=Verminephrobacter eiseniae (strain EF01-2) TaxID=391735 RepID=A1WJK5_VEREI|nr:ABC transporter ATP-binding protein [Verminephrobacter eiseniae]ABM57812.1 oligopeptide/dipeptide ABC transporter, ATPase subunit [Verminephrobacter eiseniae EF01-2]MCW5283419.1 ABC transporter ATP-binding protein [Verminephrobacter eiseniae]MCW5301128.1 ABC transporter ATP-binding protein [Verminephrobacter eiseniae]MCW8178606.1 ABC transporter ATP-binding protein [Verminephrobacter eiseniae]MCW8190230.1 ABC transporter ATP-binding protein [Verminephrobacter eiseniae]